MWKLWHRLFALEYVLVNDGGWNKVRRVHWTPAYEPYVVYGGEIHVGAEHWVDALTPAAKILHEGALDKRCG